MSTSHGPLRRTSRLIDKIALCQRQCLGRFRLTHHPVSLHSVSLSVHPHLRLRVVELHVSLANLSAVLDRLHAFAQSVRLNHTRGDGCLGDEGNAAGGNERCEHGTHDDGLDSGDGAIGVALHMLTNLLMQSRSVL